MTALKDKLVILVTHQVEFLAEVEKILVMKFTYLFTYPFQLFFFSINNSLYR